MAISKLSHLEENENLKQDQQSLKEWLKDIEVLTHINQFTDEDLFIQHYLNTHKYLSLEEIQIRLEEIENLLHIAKNFN